MDKKVEILLNSAKNVDSVDVDTYDKVELANKQSNILEYNVRNVASATEIFDIERQHNQVYRIYGKIEYMSLFNGLKTDYKWLRDFFNPQVVGSRDIFNTFDFYLVRPHPTDAWGPIYNTTLRKRQFQVVATPNEFELFPVGFANNVYGEQGYAFSFNIDFDISTYFDYLGFPITELFLYAQYNIGNHIPAETLERTTWSTGSGNPNTPTFTTKTLNIGDDVETSTGSNIYDLVDYSKQLYYQAQYAPQTFYVNTPYLIGTTPSSLRWKYNPFIPFRLQYLSEEVYRANTGNTVYEQVQSIPPYAADLGDGNFVWRNILDQGFIDPLTGVGVDYPFVNKRRYLFSSLVLDIVPDLTHTQTRDAFAETWFSDDAESLDITPANDLDDIGKPCQ